MKSTRFEEARFNILDIIDYRMKLDYSRWKEAGDKTLSVGIFPSDLEQIGIDPDDALSLLETLTEQGEIVLKGSIDKEDYAQAVYENDNQAMPIFRVEVSGNFSTNLPETKENFTRPISLVLGKVTFDDATAKIHFGNHTCDLRRGKNQQVVCRVMFGREPKIPVSWEEIYEEIRGDGEGGTKKDKRSVQDAVIGLLKKMALKNVKDELLTWNNGEVMRNY